MLPGREPEHLGDEARGQAVDAGLRRGPAQSAFRSTQLRLLLLLPELPAVEGLQEVHGIGSGRVSSRLTAFSLVFVFFGLRLESLTKVHSSGHNAPPPQLLPRVSKQNLQELIQ